MNQENKIVSVHISFKKNGKQEAIKVPLSFEEEEAADKSLDRIKSVAVERGQKGRAYKISSVVGGRKYFGVFFFDL